MLVRVLVLLGLVIAGGLAAGAYLVFAAPSPEAVCDHVIEVTLAEAEGTDLAPDTRKTLADRLRDACIRHKRDKLQLRGRIAYARYARCVTAATTLAEIERC